MCWPLRHRDQSTDVGSLSTSTPANWLSAYVTTCSGPEWNTRSLSDCASVAMWICAMSPGR